MKKISRLILEATSPEVIDLIGALFQSRNDAHLMHLYTNSKSKHLDLQDYYEGILDLIDSFVEEYQGENGIINITIPGSSTSDVNINYFKELVQKVNNIYKSISSTNLKAILDDILSLLQSTIYKLENLK